LIIVFVSSSAVFPLFAKFIAPQDTEIPLLFMYICRWFILAR